ncbi:Dehydrogenase, E1 component [Corchorus capsularis]|uniref:Dehydrogenase, E1 component n=1 Tax=Corchorus capsularis TaxID=210143 RepID=A0A1R3GYZ9_COCAP|nr:Dehydrogenase, E1 component [Corchorus capsularis]
MALSPLSLKKKLSPLSENLASLYKGRESKKRLATSEFSSIFQLIEEIPHAVGVAYSLKMDERDACVLTYFGDGGTSELHMI